MSDQKTLGQVAHDAFHGKPMRESGPKEDWERAAQAVISEHEKRKPRLATQAEIDMAEEEYGLK